MFQGIWNGTISKQNLEHRRCWVHDRAQDYIKNMQRLALTKTPLVLAGFWAYIVHSLKMRPYIYLKSFKETCRRQRTVTPTEGQDNGTRIMRLNTLKMQLSRQVARFPAIPPDGVDSSSPGYINNLQVLGSVIISPRMMKHDRPGI